MSDTALTEQYLLNRVYDAVNNALKVNLTNLTALDVRYMRGTWFINVSDSVQAGETLAEENVKTLTVFDNITASESKTIQEV